MATKIYEKRFTEKELTLLRFAVEFYLDFTGSDEELEDLYENTLDYNHPKYIKL